MKKIIIAIATVLAISCGSEKLSKKEMHEKQIQSLFYYNGGPHKTAYLKVQSVLNDPKSLENVYCGYAEDTTTNIVTVHWEFTAKNGFGCRVKESVIFDSDTLGNIINIYKWID